MASAVIREGLQELTEGSVVPAGRVRRPGGGRKPRIETDPALMCALDDLVADDARGDPESPLRWTCKSTRALATTLTRQQHPVSHTTVAHVLHALDYSLQSNRTLEEGTDHPDRDQQFRHINAAVKRRVAAGGPGHFG